MIDRNPADIRWVEKLLERSLRAVFRLSGVSTLEEGLELLRPGAFDAVLYDHPHKEAGPLEEGLESLLSHCEGEAVVALTALEDYEVAARVLSLGVQQYILKTGLGPESLADALLHAIHRQSRLEGTRQLEDRFSLAYKGSQDGIWDWRVTKGSFFASARARDILGLNPEDRLTSVEDWLGLVHAEDWARVKRQLALHLEGSTDYLEVEYRTQSPGSEQADERWVLWRGAVQRGSDGSAVRLAGSISDVTARKRAEQRLMHDALHDPLTAMPNWALLKDRLALAMAQRLRQGGFRFAVLFLDLDRFKAVNDTLGHAVGDRLLVAFADLLKASVRPGDTVARIGGDEFVLLLHGIDESRDATRVAKRIVQELESPLQLAGQEVFTSVSIGIALGSDASLQAEDVLRDADTAMYRAKSAGGGRYVLFDQAMHDQAQQALQLEVDLRNAVERSEFAVAYQPLFDLESLEIRGFEALVRWHHPLRGLVLPKDFIPLAEETGLIVPIGWRVLETACRQMAAWHRRFPEVRRLSVSVNLSIRQLLNADFLDRLRLALVRSGLNPKKLCVEISEGLLVQCAPGMLERLHSLKRMGVEVHMDDFGGGFSSLSDLHRLPAQALKIHRSFVSGIGGEGGRPELVSGIVALAHSLGMSVAVGGLETAEDTQRVRSMECEVGQGFWFSRPLDAIQATALVSSDLVLRR